MPTKRPTASVIAFQMVLLCAVAIAAALTGSNASWDPVLFGILLGLSVFSDITAIETATPLKVSGSFLAIVLAMVLLGGPPAALIGVLTIVIGWLHWRESPDMLLNNLLAYATFPLVGGLLFLGVTDAAEIAAGSVAYYLLVFALFLVALTINFAMIWAYTCYAERIPFMVGVQKVFLVLLPSELAAAMMASGTVVIYYEVGLGAVVLFGVALIISQHLLGALLLSEKRAGDLQVRTEQLEVRTKQLASIQVGVLSALLRTLDLRDQMTARHSAAVARYSQAIAKRAGFSKEQEELVHIAALLHDIGKFILPDRILKASIPLTEEDWLLIRRHPQQGARVVGALDGYGPVADLILAHHERVDGTGYPREIGGEEIPELARIISVADTYDVMTARDSYRHPMSPYQAMQELRRAAGTQLDAAFVAIFIQLLEGRDIDFFPEERPDFERELALETRIAEAARPVVGVIQSAADGGAAADAQAGERTLAVARASA
jgi:putative nucleotidyltransferase with HDIG domain